MVKIGKKLQTWDVLFDKNKWIPFVASFEARMLKRNPSCCWEITKVTDNGKTKEVSYTQAINGDQLLLYVLKEIKYSFFVHVYGKGFAIQQFSDENPDGDEWYLLQSITKTAYQKHVK